MGAMASQITSLTIVYSTVYSGADQRKHQSSASLAFVWGIHRGPVNSPHKGPVTRKIFPFDDVIMSFVKWIWWITKYYTKNVTADQLQCKNTCGNKNVISYTVKWVGFKLCISNNCPLSRNQCVISSWTNQSKNQFPKVDVHNGSVMSGQDQWNHS